MTGLDHTQDAFPLEKDPLPILQETVLKPGPVWTIGEKSVLPGFDPRTDHDLQSLYTG